MSIAHLSAWIVNTTTESPPTGPLPPPFTITAVPSAGGFTVSVD